MRKLVKFLVVCLAVVICGSAFMVSAETNKKEWSRMTGPSTLTITKDGVVQEASEGVSFYKYTKEMIDLKDFTCVFTLESDEFFDGHDTGEHQYYYNITLSDKASFSGSSGLFLLLMPQNARSMRIEGQILHSSYLLHPTYVEFDVDTLSDIVMHGKLLLGTGEGGADQYEISFDNCKEKYLFDIPENYQFQKANDGKAYFSFGMGADGHDNQKMTVKKINNIDTLGTEEEEPASKPATDTGATDTTANNTAATDNTVVSSGTSLSNGTLIFMIIAIAVIFLVVVAGFVVLILIVNKKFNSIIGGNPKG